MAINKVISAVGFASAAVLLHQTTPVGAGCACTQVYRLPSGYAAIGAVVMRADVTSRFDVGDKAIYGLNINTLYAGEPGVEYGDSVWFVTAASTDDCGVDLTIGGDYLVGPVRRDIYPLSPGGEVLTMTACNLNKLWSDVSDEEHEDLDGMLEDGDADTTTTTTSE